MMLNTPIEGTKDMRALNVISRHWQSDLAFYLEELRFLKTLTDRYYIWLNDNKSIEATSAIRKRLMDTDALVRTVQEFTTNHVHHGTQLERNPVSYGIEKFMDEHAVLESQFAAAVNHCRELKRAVFKLTERVLEKEDLSTTLRNR